MRILLLYYSGAGNTKFISNILYINFGAPLKITGNPKNNTSKLLSNKLTPFSVILIEFTIWFFSNNLFKITEKGVNLLDNN